MINISAGRRTVRDSVRATGQGLPPLPTLCPSCRHGKPLQPLGRTRAPGEVPAGQRQPPAATTGGLPGRAGAAAGAGRHPPLPGETRGEPRGGPGLAARGLRAGQAAIPRLPAGGAGLQRHAAHALVHLAVFLRGGAQRRGGAGLARSLRAQRVPGMYVPKTYEGCPQRTQPCRKNGGLCGWILPGQPSHAVPSLFPVPLHPCNPQLLPQNLMFETLPSSLLLHLPIMALNHVVLEQEKPVHP